MLTITNKELYKQIDDIAWNGTRKRALIETNYGKYNAFVFENDKKIIFKNITDTLFVVIGIDFIDIYSSNEVNVILYS